MKLCMLVHYIYICLCHFIIIEEKEFQQEVTTTNGKTGASIPFLNDISCDHVIEVQSRKCYQILHKCTSISSEVLLIDEGKFVMSNTTIVKIS